MLCSVTASHSINAITSPLQKAIIEQKNKDLFFAILDDKPSIKTIEMLLKQGANPNAKSWDVTETPVLIAAVLSGNEAVVALLLAHGADINGVDGQGNSALLYAVVHDQISHIEFLLKKGIALNVKIAAFMRAICTGKEEAVRLLIASGVDLKMRDEDGGTPLMVAIVSNQLEIARLLIANGADVNETCINNLDITPLHAAALDGNPAMVQLLIENGADITVIDRDGKNCIRLCSQKG